MSDEVELEWENIVPEDWSWAKMMEVLGGDGDPVIREKTTQNLRGLMGHSFEQLRDAINNPDHVSCWSDPWLGIRLEVPWDRIVSVPRAEYDPANPPEVPRCADETPFQLLTSGAMIIKQGEMHYPSYPVPILERLFTLPPEKQRPYFEKWLDPDRWMGRVSYGDPFEAEADIYKGSLCGEGRRGGFHAAIAFFIVPQVIDQEEEESYIDVHVGLPWKGLSPDAWDEADRQALWHTVLTLLSRLADEARGGERCPSRIITEVEAETPTAMRRFVATARRENGPSLIDLAQLQPIEKSILGPIPEYVRGREGPTLALTNADGALHEMSSIELFAAMFYPEDESLRRRFIEAHMGYLATRYIPERMQEEGEFDLDDPEQWLMFQRALLSTYLRPWISHEVQSRVAASPPFEEVLSQAMEASAGGIDAGEILVFALHCAEHHPEHLSISKAVYLVKYNRTTMKNGDERLAKRSRATLLSNWKKFKSVAHLWAALRVVQEAEVGVGGEFLPAPGKELDFLAIAELIRHRGITNFGRTGMAKHGPVLDPSTTWRTPEHLRLPSATFEIPPLPARALERLAKYDGRKKRSV